MRTIIMATVAAALLAGCAGTGEPQGAREDKGDVIIGSHLPRRDPKMEGVAILGRDAVEREQSRSGGPKHKGDEKVESH